MESGRQAGIGRAPPRLVDDARHACRRQSDVGGPWGCEGLRRGVAQLGDVDQGWVEREGGGHAGVPVAEFGGATVPCQQGRQRTGLRALASDMPRDGHVLGPRQSHVEQTEFLLALLALEGEAGGIPVVEWGTDVEVANALQHHGKRLAGLGHQVTDLGQQHHAELEALGRVHGGDTDGGGVRGEARIDAVDATAVHRFGQPVLETEEVGGRGPAQQFGHVVQVRQRPLAVRGGQHPGIEALGGKDGHHLRYAPGSVGPGEAVHQHRGRHGILITSDEPLQGKTEEVGGGGHDDGGAGGGHHR